MSKKNITALPKDTENTIYPKNKATMRENNRNITDVGNHKEQTSQKEYKKRQTDKKKSRRQSNRFSSLKWDKLDNTANLFPVIVSESVSNVYRISATLSEEIEPDLLQKALDKILPYFDVFHEKLKKGIFWYYFEINNKPAPRVTPENTYPCLFINQYTNNEYLFRVTYYQKRINLEVFHVLTDGNGAIMFLKELIYQYLRYKYSELKEKSLDTLSSDTSLNKEDSYIRNYKKSAKKGYKTEKAVILKGERLSFDHFGIIHGYIKLEDIKRVSKSYGVTINQYLIGVLTWSIYKEYLKGMPSNIPISTCIPVNLRPYFDSNTMKNFFAVVSAVFKPTKETYTFEEVLSIITDCLNEQICKENLEKLFSYNVSNEVNLIIRAVPRIIKNIAMKRVYKSSARANTSTVTNLGIIKVAPEYENYIDAFHVVLSMSKGQNIKGSVCSYKGTLTFTFSAAIRETNIQRCFFRKIAQDGIHVSIESNGVYYE